MDGPYVLACVTELSHCNYTDAGSQLADYFTLKMEAIRSSETSVYPSSTQRHIPEDNILLCTDVDCVVPQGVNVHSHPYRAGVDNFYSVQYEECFPKGQGTEEKIQHLKTDQV
jgi:hypothetical protein